MMNIKVEKKELEIGVNKVARAIDQRTVVPILTGIKLEATDEKLELIGSDSTISIQTSVIEGLKVIEEGGIVLPAKEFQQIVKALPNDEVNIKVDENFKAIITVGKSKFNLNGTDANQYPKIKNKKAETIFVSEANQIANAIDKTVFAVSKMESRPILTGVNFHDKNGSLVMVATDSHRLSRVETEIETLFEGEFTLPSKALKELSSLLRGDGEIKVLKSENNVLFEDETTTIVTRLMSGNFPETDRLIPNEGTTTMKVNRRAFLESLERSRILAKDDKTVIFEISDENSGIFDTVKLQQQSQELGVSEEDIVVNEIEGEELSIGFNADYVIESLKALDDDEVVFSFTGAMRPFTIVDSNDSGTLQLVLPVRRY